MYKCLGITFICISTSKNIKAYNIKTKMTEKSYVCCACKTTIYKCSNCGKCFCDVRNYIHDDFYCEYDCMVEHTGYDPNESGSESESESESEDEQ